MSTDLLKKYAEIVNEAGGYGDNDGPGMLDQPDTFEIRQQLDELEEALYTVIEIARSLERSGRNVSGPFSGQLNAYFIPWMKAWIEDTNQPGSVESLRRILANDD